MEHKRCVVHIARDSARAIMGSNPPVLPEPEAPAAIPPDAARSDVEPRGLQLTNIDLEVRESQTARTLAITLVIMLGVTFVANVVTLVVLTIKNRLDAVPSFERMFAIWTPLLSGLVGSAVTFYLTKERK